MGRVLTVPRGALIIAVDIDILMDHARKAFADADWQLIALIGAPALLALFVLVTLLSKRPDRRITMLATAIGLGWSAQGMWDTATKHYGVTEQLAAVLFVLFEAFMVGRMLTANIYRDDPVRRARPVRFVWTLAVVMGAVVALAEGPSQAPLRFSVPLLVAWNWYLDLTADDDPAKAERTSWRWTPRRLLLAVGALEPGERDVETVDRDRHIARMTMLAFRLKNGEKHVSDVLHRKERLMRLALAADEGMVREMHERLDRSEAILTRPEPIRPPVSRLHVPRRELVLPHKEPAAGVQGVHLRDDVPLRGQDLHNDGVTLVLASVDPARPRGMTNAELAAHYVPPLGRRTAEAIGAAARKKINGQRVG
jgi:hypothetical protein